jgi:hypothetical protein
MLLLNEEQVSAAIRGQLYKMAEERKGRHRRMALYAEREFDGTRLFESSLTPDRHGRMRQRAVGRKGPDAVKPIRGSSRVGSEGLIAFVISQAKEAYPQIFMNHPGPDLIRGRSRPAGSIVIVTDFIGSGSRVRSMLDAFWAVPSVRAWHSLHLVDFVVVAAVGTASGKSNVQRHRVHPAVVMQHVAPTIGSTQDWRLANQWYSLMNSYGPDAGRGAGRFGFGKCAALVAFNYRLPNNTPALVHKSKSGWKALFDGPAPEELRPAFGLRSAAEVVASATERTGASHSPDLRAVDAKLVLILSLLRGRWRKGAEITLAERTGIAVPDVMDVLRKALRDKLITSTGRLTDEGQAILSAGRQRERKRPEIATKAEPYYPFQLRTPGVSSSTRRPFGRP